MVRKTNQPTPGSESLGDVDHYDEVSRGVTYRMGPINEAVIVFLLSIGPNHIGTL
jgi:hypothetical protein